MKHRTFNEVKPYGYFLIRKSDGMKYVGVRYGNVKLNLTPSEDFGKVYFTSGRLRKQFRKRPEDFIFKLKYSFDTIEEMFEWEKKITLRVYKYEDWANQGWATNFGENPRIGSLISEGKRRVKRCGKTSIQIGAEHLKDWIWNTEEGRSYRQDISKKQQERWADLTDEEILKISNKRKENMDFFSASKKAAETMRTVGEDGLTTHQRKARKSAKTRKEVGSDLVAAEKYKEWAHNTEAGGRFKREMSEKMKSVPRDVRKTWTEKSLETKKNHSEEKKFQIKQKFQESICRITENGNTVKEESTKKMMETKKARGSDKIASKKRSELFNKKLGEMSEQEFEEYCAKYIPRLAKSFRTRRQKYLESQSE